MKFGVFYEHQLPRPWGPDSELHLFQQTLEQVELADRLGYQYVWQVEHHFLEEYAHSTAPEVLLAAYSQRTRDMRLAHGIIQTPPQYNHPARIAERVATLDLVSGGRAEFGTGESSSEAELGGFGIPREEKRDAWREGTDVTVRLLTEEPFTGHEGKYLSMPARNCIPKPVQKPHPPLWLACSRRETIGLAAETGMGALTTAFVNAAEAERWVQDYQRIMREECLPIGKAVNPNIAIVTALMCCPTEEEARAKGETGVQFFGYALAWHYVFGSQRPGRTSIAESFEQNRERFAAFRQQQLKQTPDAIRGCIGTPEQCLEVLRAYEEAGVDQVVFVSQAGPNRHEDICESYELLAKEVLPEFWERDEGRADAKRRQMEEINEKALARKQETDGACPALDPDYRIEAPMADRFGGTFAGAPDDAVEEWAEARRRRRS